MHQHPSEHIPNDTSNIKEQAVTWSLSILGAVSAWAVLAILVRWLHKPDIAAIKAVTKSVLIDSAHARPEPTESLLFRLSVIVVVPLAIFLHKWLSGSHLVQRLFHGLGFHILSWGGVAALALLLYGGMAAWNPYGPKGGDEAQNMRDPIGVTNFDFYFKGLLTGDHLWAYLLIILPLFALLFLYGFRQRNMDTSASFKISVNIIGYTTTAFLIVAIVAMNTIHFPYTDENKFDFAAVYYAATQVFSGQPMLVDGFIDTYGLYPHFLLPLFRITGLSVLTFSLTMSLLLGLSFILNLWIMRKLIKDTTLFFLGFCTLVFFPYLDFKLLTIFDCIFSLYPIRYIIPSVTAALALLYFTKPTRTRFYTTFLVSGLFILWNPEIGLSCYMAWTFADLYANFYDNNGKVNIKGLALHLITSIALFSLVLLGYKLFVYLGYGSWPQIGLLFNPILYFSRYGMSLLPMSLLHPWNISALVLLLGFIYAGAAWHQKNITVKSTMVLFLSLVGLGYFTYFQGRSQNSNYALSSGFSLIVLTILADELWQKIRTHKEPALYGLFIIALCCLSFSFPEVIYNARKIVALSDQEGEKQAQAHIQERIETNATFIENTTAEREKIILFSAKKLQPLFFNGSKRRSGFNPGYIDIFQNSDLDRLMDVIIDSPYKVYLEPSARIYDFMERHLQAVAATHEYATDNGKMAMLERRRTKLPTATFFTGSDLLFHRKYTDDRASILQRIADADGVQPMPLEGSFTISALFHTPLQFTDRPVVVGNITDSCGFIIGGINKPDLYIFGVNGVGMSVGFPRKTWCYTVMNVTPTGIQLFVNGKHIGSRNIPAPIRNPTQKMGIGNLGDFHYFTGAIAEIAISRGNIDSNTIKATWQQIQPHLDAP